MTNAPRALPRRTILAASGTAVLAATAAACGSSDPAPASTSSAAASSSAASSSAASSGSSAAPATSAAIAPPTSATPSVAEQSAATTAAEPEPSAALAAPTPTGTPLAAVADVEAAGSVVVDGPILLAASNGTIVAHSAVCTHQSCTVGAAGADAACPCHGSRFNAATGAVLNGPAQRPLPEVAVTVANGQVYAG